LFDVSDHGLNRRERCSCVRLGHVDALMHHGVASTDVIAVLRPAVGLPCRVSGQLMPELLSSVVN
jgi:hypothetical protein